MKYSDFDNLFMGSKKLTQNEKLMLDIKSRVDELEKKLNCHLCEFEFSIGDIVEFSVCDDHPSEVHMVRLKGEIVDLRKVESGLDYHQQYHIYVRDLKRTYTINYYHYSEKETYKITKI